MNKYEISRLEGTTQLRLDQGLVLSAKKDFDLYIFSDIHVGAMEFNKVLFQDAVAHAHCNPKARVILSGDLIEGIPRGHKISERGQYSTPDFQIAEFIRLIDPIKHKIDLIYKGNHNPESRGESIDSDFVIAQQLKVPYKTVPTVIQYKTAVGAVRVCGGHGKSGAVNPDTELFKLSKIFPNNQIYHLGHTHHLYAKHMGTITFNAEGNEDWIDSWFVRSGNFLNYAEYARYSFYPPQRSGFPLMQIRNGKVTNGLILTSSEFTK